jgi:hypothetical protein
VIAPHILHLKKKNSNSRHKIEEIYLEIKKKKDLRKKNRECPI